MAKNPVIRGFNPDPAICRAGDDYYIATSTFEWFPGVQIHHSKDLQNWDLIARPLDEARLLDLTGVPDSCGIWAPCLTFADGLFWLIYTNVQRFDGNFKDTPNFLTTASSINGPWSDPVFLNSSGFDPSLFHDDDRRKWLVNMVWDHRPDRSFFGGIMLQEYSVEEQRLIGPRENIFPGSPHDGTEGPHLYKRDGYYYLLCAEGGTGYEHAMTVARSKTINGPYEVDPRRHLLTAKDAPDHSLQRAGHGGIVETGDGRLFATYLCSRPLLARESGPQKTDTPRRSPMGRETGIQQIFYRNGWFYPDEGNGDVRPALDPFSDCPVPDTKNIQYEFCGDSLPIDFQWLRTPDKNRVFSLSQAPGKLRIFGRNSIGSTIDQSLVARRQTEFVYSASALIEFEPEDFQQMAGLVTYYNGHKFHYLYISHDPEIGRYAGIMSCPADLSTQVQFPDWSKKSALNDGPVELSVQVSGRHQQFYVKQQNGTLTKIGPELDASLLSDECGKGEGANFTGNFVGMAVQDLTGQGYHADFSQFNYQSTPTDAGDLA